jgi:predicted membrane-bound dolichyl-phosphate-mannose-protein mannosyltransferase
VEDQAGRRAALIASIALLFFGALTALALVGWFYRNESPWNWKSVLAVGCSVLAVATSALVWRTPSRTHAILGIVVMLASLARIGAPVEWTWVSFALVAVTFVLLMPLVHAAIVLRPDE